VSGTTLWWDLSDIYMQMVYDEHVHSGFGACNISCAETDAGIQLSF
jgi:hypothetical protein